jgi:hypothetical protein
MTILTDGSLSTGFVTGMIIGGILLMLLAAVTG